MKNILKNKIFWKLILSTLFLIAFYAFVDRYFVQVPFTVKFRCLVCRRSNTPSPTPKAKLGVSTIKITPTLTPTPLVSEIYKKAYDKVWLSESGRGNDKTGLNGYCLTKGMINEIGYAPPDNYCFKNRKEQEETFYLWLDNRLSHKKMPWCNSIGECLLIYSAGAYSL